MATVQVENGTIVALTADSFSCIFISMEMGELRGICFAKSILEFLKMKNQMEGCMAFKITRGNSNQVL